MATSKLICSFISVPLLRFTILTSPFQCSLLRHRLLVQQTPYPAACKTTFTQKQHSIPKSLPTSKSLPSKHNGKTPSKPRATTNG
ncbi:hypothetical protein M0R45_037846 [Rubus argutus]|uniref:Secreted protein n=1 Tax=Rubus argutus TaxID=59490 RepID=A0AAW1W5C0_RUBAR